MTPEVWIESQPFIPVSEPEALLPAEFAFTKKQRDWYLRVFNNHCWFPISKDDGALIPCGERNHLEVHHITPDAWTRAQEPWQDPNDTLGIPLCKAHHDYVIHPDIGRAIQDYQYDVNSFKKAIGKHKEAAQSGEIFWNDEYDEALRTIAENVILKYSQEHPFDPYPKDGAWGEKEHPKKSHWTDIF